MESLNFHSIDHCFTSFNLLSKLINAKTLFSSVLVVEKMDNVSDDMEDSRQRCSKKFLEVKDDLKKLGN